MQGTESLRAGLVILSMGPVYLFLFSLLFLLIILALSRLRCADLGADRAAFLTAKLNDNGSSLVADFTFNSGVAKVGRKMVPNNK